MAKRKSSLTLEQRMALELEKEKQERRRNLVRVAGFVSERRRPGLGRQLLGLVLYVALLAAVGLVVYLVLASGGI